MPYKDKEKKDAYNKEYRKINGKEIDTKRTKTLQDRLKALSPEEQEEFIKKRREIVLKSYYKHREKTLEKNRNRNFKYDLKWRYGITHEEYLEILEHQNKKCAICGCGEFEKRWTSKKLPFAIDHCHSSKKIRGLLCDNCNVLIGHAHENIEILKNAIIYLQNDGSNKTGETLYAK